MTKSMGILGVLERVAEEGRNFRSTSSIPAKVAGEENRSKELSSKSESGYVNKRRKLTRSKRQRFKLELTKEAGNSEKSSKEIVNAVRILQRRTSGHSADERERSGFAEGHGQGDCTVWKQIAL